LRSTVLLINRRYEEWRTELWERHLKEKDHLEDLGLDGRIIFKWFLNKRSLSRG